MGNEAATPSTRDGIETGAALEHGGRLLEARRRFPQAPAPFLDLSTGINPIPYPVGDLPPSAWTQLPEPDALERLQRAAALAYRVADPAMVVAAPGTQILIGLLPHFLGHGRAAILGPTYGEHVAAWRNAGADATEIADFTARACAPCAVLCNPNNPDGRRIDPATLLQLAETLAAVGGTLIVDEAFADFDPALSVAPSLPHPALIVLRSFGKAYGLAGLRLGFALAAPSRAAQLRAALGPWAVSGPAAAIGTQALHDSAWRDGAQARLVHDASRLDALLHRASFRPIGGTVLFRLVEHPDAASICHRLGEAGIVVRRFAAWPTRLRFGLPGAQPSWDRLENALLT